MGIDLKKLYFPLRSNFGWFQSVDLQTEISNRLKQALILYDEITIEDGTYEGMIIENLGFELYTPSSLSSDRSISLEKDIKDTDISLWIQPDGPGTEPKLLASGRTITRFKIDYAELINKLDLAEYDFIKLVTVPDGNLSEEIKTVIRQQTQEDKRIIDQVEKNPFLKNTILKNLNRDLIVSHLLGSSMIIDPIHQEILEIKSRLSLHDLQILPDKESAIVRRLLKVKAPNFQDLTIPQVIELRKDSLWQEFRRNIHNISSMISDNPDVLLDSKIFDETIRDAIDKALFMEIEKRGKDGKELTADIVLGGLSLIPPLGIPTSAVSLFRSIAEFYEHRNGWVAFLLKVSTM